MAIIASVPFQYDPTGSGVTDIPYLSGIESSMAWMDSVVSRHDLSGPLVSNSGFEWYKYYSEDKKELITPQLAPPFALEGVPMNVSGFWGQFNDKIAFLGRETGGDYDDRPFTNHSNNTLWSGDYRNPIFPWALSGQNTKPLPEGMFEYGQIDKDDFNTYIKKYAGIASNFTQRHAIRRRILGQGHVQNQVGIVQAPTMDSQSEFTETITMSSGASDELIEVKERHITRVWSVSEDCNQTYDNVMNVAKNDAIGSGEPWLKVEYYVNEGGGFNSDPYRNTNWFWQIGKGSGYDIGPVGRTMADVTEEYWARNFTIVNDLGTSYQMGKSSSFGRAPTEVIYSLKKRLALQGSGYGIYSNFTPGASSVSPCSSTAAIGEYNFGYKMGNASLTTAASKSLLFVASGYEVFHTEGPVTNGTPPYVTAGNVDPVFLDGDTSNRYVYLTNTIDDLEPQTTHPQKSASWWSYFVEQITEVSGIETNRKLVSLNNGPGGGHWTNPRVPSNTQTTSGCINHVAADIHVPVYPGGYSTGYYLSGALISQTDYLGHYRGQSAYRTHKTPPAGQFSIGGIGSWFGVDRPVDIFNSGVPNVGPFFNL